MASNRPMFRAAPLVLMALLLASPSYAVAEDAGELMSRTEAQVRDLLGLPEVARKEGAGAIWTYRMPECALLVMFRSADGRTFQVVGAESGARRLGQNPLGVRACIEKAKARPRERTDEDAIGAFLDPRS